MFQKKQNDGKSIAVPHVCFNSDLIAICLSYSFENQVWIVGERNRLMCDVLCWQNGYHPHTSRPQTLHLSSSHCNITHNNYVALVSSSVLDTCTPSGGKDWYTATDLFGYRFDKLYTTQTPSKVLYAVIYIASVYAKSDKSDNVWSRETLLWRAWHTQCGRYGYRPELCIA